MYSYCFIFVSTFHSLLFPQSISKILLQATESHSGASSPTKNMPRSQSVLNDSDLSDEDLEFGVSFEIPTLIHIHYIIYNHIVHVLRNVFIFKCMLCVVVEFCLFLLISR